MPSLYHPIHEDDTRLLTIQSYDDHTAVCELSTYSPSDIPDYDAVTYAWGDETATTTITCNGHPLSIRSSLLSGLRHIHTYRPDPKRPLWIDAICLNQDDDGEKATQVPRMGKIYQSASRTLIWLGDGDEDSDLAMDSILPLTETLVQLHADGRAEQLQQAYAHSSSLESHGLPNQNGPVWKALASLLLRPWFSRLWTLQEAVLATELLVICGQKTLPWSAIITYLNAVTDLGMAILLTLGVMETEDTRLGRRPIDQIEMMRQLLPRNPNAINFHLLLEFSVGRRYTEPVDRIWALLGLLQSYGRRLIAAEPGLVDYSELGKKDYYVSYQNVMRLLVREQPYYAMPLLAVGCVQARTTGQPSWHTDWHGARLYEPISNLGKCAAGYPNNCTRNPYPIMAMVDPSSLNVLGIRVSTVKDVTSLPGQIFVRFSDEDVTRQQNEMQTSCKWMANCFHIAQSTHPMAAERSHFHRPNSPAPAAATEPSIPTLWKRHTDFANVLKSMLFPTQPTPEYDVGLLIIYCNGRNFFTTTDGRVGMGPPGTRAGDRVCAFYGGRPLFLLRPQAASRRVAPEFELVGDAYVPGLMHGEAFPGRSCEDLEHFTLV